MAQQQPTLQQIAALKQFAQERGRRWKSQLLSDWMDGSCEVPELVQVRNNLGPRWLVKCRLNALSQQEQTTICVYCYASGLIEFGRIIPDGALPIASGPAEALRDFIEPLARHGYQTQLVNGRPTKVPGTETLLVPGIPEAPDQFKALDALQAFTKWIGKCVPDGITVV